jgi:DNA-directed RNA polymerase beta subunit
MNDSICWDILDTYFQKGGSQESVNPLIKHQIDSYNKFLDNTLAQIITGFNPIRIGLGFKQEINDHIHKIYINVLQPSLTKPSYQLSDGTQTVMTPHIARMNNLTYSSNLYVKVHLVIEVINEDGIIEKIDKTINNVYIGKIPVMVRSKACVLYQIPGLGEENNNECRYDFGGYFIINGNEKVLISQDRINENKTLVFQPNNNTDGLYAEIRSMSDSTYLPPKTTSLNMSGKLNHMGRIIRLSTSFLRNEIPIFIMFRALGIISDEEIIQHIVHDLDNKDNQRIITELMACCEDACDIHTQEQAENMLVKIMTGANKTVKAIEVLRTNIINDFLPHVGKNYRRKALYLGFMIRKMIRIYLGYDTYDNRDSYMNKRIDTPGILMSNLFRQCYGKMTKEMKNLIERELNLWRANQTVPTSEIITDINIHRYFKQSLLDSWLKYSLSTGNWGIKSIGSFQNIRQGVSQVLNRMSYASTLSHLRRINTAMEKNGKLVQPRKLDNSQMGMICPAECFALDTPILLWNGTIKKAEDIIVGDYLIDDKGNAVRVKSTCSGEKMMYEVIQHKSNFMNYTVTDNHILTLKVKYHKYIRNSRGKVELSWFNKKELKYNYKGFNNIEELNEFALLIDDDNVIDITIEKYLSLSKNIQSQLYMFKSDGINWETKEVALDPYILGMWLGDGLSKGYGFITADKELLDEWVKWGATNDATITKNKHKYRYTISSTINNTQSGISCNKTEKGPLKKLLDKYGLVNNKHIPLEYLTNDRKTRLAVLAGLIDTDGNVRANGHEIRICQGEPNYRIIYDTEFLARSLGFSCHLNDGVCSYTVNGEKRYKPYKELTITGKYVYEIPTVLPRKKLNKCNNKSHEKRCDSSLQSSFELVKKDIQPFVGWQLENDGRFLLGDMSISHNTPEGASVGLVKNMALSTHISVSMNSAYIRTLLIEFGVVIYDDSYSYKIENEEKWFNETDELKEKRKNITKFLKELGNYDNVYVQINGDIIGYHTTPHELYEKIKHYKKCGIIHPMTSIIWNIKHRFIAISTEAGRMYRPLLIVDYNEKLGKRELRITKILREKNLTWEEFSKDKSFDSYISPCAGNNFDLEEEGFIEYLDSDEVNHAMIAMNMGELDKGIKGTALPPLYTHCEIHPSLMNGILGVNIPFSDHNQSPRNCYQSAMGKQALGVYMSNFNKRIDTMGNILNYPQKPIVFTKLSKYTYSSELPSGTNAIVAIMTHTGFNQEDSVMINQSALDRGLFTSTYYKAFRDQCTKNHSTGEEEVFSNPTGSASLKPFSYEKLDDTGFVPKNTFVNGDDILIGKVMPKKINGTSVMQDNSTCMKANDEGYVDMNYTGINSEGYKFCKIRVRKNRKPEIGDKLASRSAQKGTIGMVYRHQDMPFTKDGIVPDIIMNPHAIPSRMTMAQLMECIMGKAACHIGTTGDSSPYNDCSVESIAKVLELSGMERYGNEIMYNGRTGEQIQTEIFIGPTYYQRLKHMVQDKLHSRGSNGPIVMLTRQPSEGRARNGGLRLGEMERDCLISHGCSGFLKERMLDSSDNYRVFICKLCGIVANVNPDKNIYKCPACKNCDIIQTRIPYAFKLLGQELYTMNILMRYICN